MAALTLRDRVEIVTNGIVITNRLTGHKEMAPNSAKEVEYAKSFVASAIASGEPGDYFDIDITITKSKNKKPC